MFIGESIPSTNQNELLKSTPNAIWTYDSSNYEIINDGFRNKLTDLSTEIRKDFIFEDINGISEISYDQNNNEITITNTIHDETYLLKNIIVDETNNQFNFDLYENGDLIDGQVQLGSSSFQVKSFPCPLCSLIDAVSETIEEIVEAVREHRRLSSCEGAMQACIDQGRTPEVTVTEGGGCTVKCLKDGAE